MGTDIRYALSSQSFASPFGMKNSLQGQLLSTTESTFNSRQNMNPVISLKKKKGSQDETINTYLCTKLTEGNTKINWIYPLGSCNAEEDAALICFKIETHKPKGRDVKLIGHWGKTTLNTYFIQIQYWNLGQQKQTVVKRVWVKSKRSQVHFAVSKSKGHYSVFLWEPSKYLAY